MPRFGIEVEIERHRHGVALVCGDFVRGRVVVYLVEFEEYGNVVPDPPVRSEIRAEAVLPLGFVIASFYCRPVKRVWNFIFLTANGYYVRRQNGIFKIFRVFCPHTRRVVSSGDPDVEFFEYRRVRSEIRVDGMSVYVGKRMGV